MTHPQKIKLKLNMDKIKKSNEAELTSYTFSLLKESADVIKSKNPTSLLFYVKTGKKYWVIGDQEGIINMHLLNGTYFKETPTNLGEIKTLERFGQTLVFSTVSSVGVLSPTSLEVASLCHNLGKVHDICIDTMSSSSYVYALTNERILALDTKHQQNNENFCKSNF